MPERESMARWVWRNVACLGNKGRPAEGKTPRDNWVTANCHGLRELRSAADGQDDEVVVLTPLGLSMLEDAQGDENAHGEPGLRRQAAIPITPAQRRILEAIRAHMDAHGVPPTQKELGEALGLNPMTAREHLHHLQGRGALRLMKGRRRGIEMMPGALGDPDPWAALKALMRSRGIPAEEVKAAFGQDDPTARDGILSILRGGQAG